MKPLRDWLPCQETDPEVFFSVNAYEVAAAQRLCGECHVKGRCLAGAIKRQEEFGIWGGEYFREGKPVDYKPPGRQKKIAVFDDESFLEVLHPSYKDRLAQ